MSDGNTLLSSTKNSLQIKKKMAKVKDINENDIDKEDEGDLDDQGENEEISYQVVEDKSQIN